MSASRLVQTPLAFHIQQEFINAKRISNQQGINLQMNTQAIFSENDVLARKTHKFSFIAFSALVGLVVLHFIGLRTEQEWTSEVKMLKILVFVTFHILLGLSAKQSGRSFLLYGLVSVFPPILGGSVALVILWQKLRAADCR
ncbi:hypothetical protein [Janthinobacterium sp. HH01]|uniref:hypothetical protein n=1 Tax=Janthinobacterium sp. HH01 TaxID=1198452 RepID=UPI00126821DF|nr:hypothetical protein [Janthinobacterium sp. HH01]